jgi:hypothetical protein
MPCVRGKTIGYRRKFWNYGYLISCWEKVLPLASGKRRMLACEGDWDRVVCGGERVGDELLYEDLSMDERNELSKGLSQRVWRCWSRCFFEDNYDHFDHPSKA